MNIVITGASKGLGKAIALGLAAPGHSLFLSSRSKAGLEAVRAEILSLAPQCQVYLYPADLSRTEEAKNFGAFVLQTAVPDVLVNNAGLFNPGSVHNEPEGSLEEMMAVNLYSAYHLTRMFTPGMIQRKSGHIFNMCSIASLNAYDNGGAYSISKFALYGFSKNLRKELMPHSIKVTHIIPGAVYTDSWSGSGIDPKRIMEANDIARLVKTAMSLSPQACVEEIVVRPTAGDL